MNVSGYQGHSPLVRARTMKNNNDSIFQFYALTNQEIYVYRLISQTEVTLSLKVSGIGDGTISPIGNIY